MISTAMPAWVRGLAAASLACLASACVTTQQTLSPSGFSASPVAPATFIPAPRDADTAGFEIEGAEFHAVITFREINGRAVALFSGNGFATGRVETEFDLTQPWVSDGERVYTEGSSVEPVSVSMRTHPCPASDGVWAREASVAVGRLVYLGCARETGPYPSWTENLPALMADIGQCVSAARNSDGVMNRAGSCVPRGKRRSRSSATVIVASRASGLRLIVSNRNSPPGRSTRATWARTCVRSLTCSSTSTQTTASNWLAS